MRARESVRALRRPLGEILGAVLHLAGLGTREDVRRLEQSLRGIRAELERLEAVVDELEKKSYSDPSSDTGRR